MLVLKNKTVETEYNGEYTTTHYDVEGFAQCDGSGIWSDTNGRVVNVSGITISEEVYDDDYVYKHITVAHDGTWDIYTDRGFEAAISAALGFEVSFTEQGMQEDGLASMET